MSIFKRSSGDVQKTGAAPSPEAGRAGVLPEQPAPMPASAAPGVVPPPAAPTYSMRTPQSVPRFEGDGESPLAAKVRMAREAQESAQERVRLAVQRSTLASPAPGVRRRPAHQPAPPPSRTPMPGSPFDPDAYAQAGLLSLAWRWQEAGAPIRAIHAYVELLTRYPDTPAARTAVADLVELSERLVDDGQFHTALVIYDHLEHLA